MKIRSRVWLLCLSLTLCGLAQAQDVSAASAGAGASATGFATAPALAFVGGLILNLMPCVLPVLSMKAVGLLESRESTSRARRHALLYTAGVLSAFIALGGVVLGLRAAGNVSGWGAQLQQPVVVAVLACVMVAIGLSMSGVINIGSSFGGYGDALASRKGWVGDYFTGVLAVVVASPCVAPFMGTALAYAFFAPMYAAIPVFVALGLGLSLPFLLIGFVPGAGRILPRPGPWMETFKQVLAFPMYLTAAWLVWVLAHQRGADAVGLVLLAVVLVAFALWWFERSRNRGVLARAVTVMLALLVIAPLYLVGQMQAPTRQAPKMAEAGKQVAFSPEKLAELRKSGTPVFVDMTADWCITCKANEHEVLNTDKFRKLLKRTGTVYMVGDWTDTNDTIAKFLHKYHSPGVPLYVVFPGDGGAGKVLPNVLTFSIVHRELLAAAQ
jgi:thiol:disulfide interchange protein DsbD